MTSVKTIKRENLYIEIDKTEINDSRLFEDFKFM
ncbi:MAG: hypothetical protein MEFUS_01144 [Fusobacterium varium]